MSPGRLPATVTGATMARKHLGLVPLSRYRVLSHPPGFTVVGPGVKVRIFSEVADTAVMLRDALDLAFRAGKTDRRPARRRVYR